MKRLFRMMVLLFSTLFSLGAVELWFRHQEDETGLWLPHDEPGRRYALKVNPPMTNDQGFNERELPLKASDDTWRVVVVGDSVTFGGGVKREEVYTRVAENELNRRGVKAEVINCAVYGYDADQVAATLHHRGWRYEPDLVVYAAYTNDGDPTRLLRLSSTGTNIYVGGSDSALGSLLLDHSAVARRVAGAWVTRKDRGVRWSDEEVHARFEGAMDTMMAESAERRVPFLVWGLVPHVLADPNPATCGGERGEYFCPGQIKTLHEIGSLALARGLPFAQILPALRSGTASSYFLPDQDDPHHPNAEGHARIGRLLAEVLLAWREGRLSELEAAQLPDIGETKPVRSEPSERPRKGLRPSKNPRAGQPRRSDAPAPGP